MSATAIRYISSTLYGASRSISNGSFGWGSRQATGCAGNRPNERAVDSLRALLDPPDPNHPEVGVDPPTRGTALRRLRLVPAQDDEGRYAVAGRAAGWYVALQLVGERNTIALGRQFGSNGRMKMCSRQQQISTEVCPLWALIAHAIVFTTASETEHNATLMMAWNELGTRDVSGSCPMRRSLRRVNGAGVPTDIDPE